MEVRKNEVSLKRKDYSIIFNSYSANFLKFVWNVFFLHDELMSFLESASDLQDVWKSCCKVMRQRGDLMCTH